MLFAGMFFTFRRTEGKFMEEKKVSKTGNKYYMIMHIPRLNMMEEEDFRSFQFREQKMWELNLIHFQRHTILQD